MHKQTQIQSGSNNIQAGSNVIIINISINNRHVAMELFEPGKCQIFPNDAVNIFRNNEIIKKPIELIQWMPISTHRISRTNSLYNSVTEKEWDLINSVLFILQEAQEDIKLGKIRTIASIRNRSKATLSKLLDTLNGIEFKNIHDNGTVSVIDKYEICDGKLYLFIAKNFIELVSHSKNFIEIDIEKVRKIRSKVAKSLYEHIVSSEKNGLKVASLSKNDLVTICNKQPHFAHYKKILLRAFLNIAHLYKIEIPKGGYIQEHGIEISFKSL